MPIASLPMYLRPETAKATGEFWQLVRDNLRSAGVEAPDQLSTVEDVMTHWQSPDLLLSQTCGMPFRMVLHDHVTLVGTPDYGLEGCPPGYYQSVLVVRKNDERENLSDYRDARFAYNEPMSQSGFSAAWFHTQRHGFHFHNLVRSGAHGLSARMVAEGNADIASLDAVTWRLIERHEILAMNLRVLERTEPTPGLPCITAKGNDAAALFSAMKGAVQSLTPENRDCLGLADIIAIPKQDYLAVPTPPTLPSD